MQFGFQRRYAGGLSTSGVTGIANLFAPPASQGSAAKGLLVKILNARCLVEPRSSDIAGPWEARDWLLDLLAAGPKGAKDVRAAAAEAGHSWAILRRAKSALKIGGRLKPIRNYEKNRTRLCALVRLKSAAPREGISAAHDYQKQNCFAVR